MGPFSRSVPSVEVQDSVPRGQEIGSRLDKSWHTPDLAPMHLTLGNSYLMDSNQNDHFSFNDVYTPHLRNISFSCMYVEAWIFSFLRQKLKLCHKLEGGLYLL